MTQRLTDVTPEDYDYVMNANARGVFGAQEVARRMIARSRGEPGSFAGGRIINVASMAGLRVVGQIGVYAMSKAAVVHMTRAMALEWARHGIRVNAIAPGYYRTDMAAGFLDSAAGQQLLKRIPQRRLGEPPELDGAILLRASGASSYMTGSVLTVDGGLSLAIV